MIVFSAVAGLDFFAFFHDCHYCLVLICLIYLNPNFLCNYAVILLNTVAVFCHAIAIYLNARANLCNNFELYKSFPKTQSVALN